MNTKHKDAANHYKAAPSHGIYVDDPNIIQEENFHPNRASLKKNFEGDLHKRPQTAISFKKQLQRANFAGSLGSQSSLLTSTQMKTTERLTSPEGARRNFQNGSVSSKEGMGIIKSVMSGMDPYSDAISDDRT